MTKLLVTPDSVALPANQSVNVAQVNGVTPLMGNGTTGTGSHRVTIASDNTAFAVNAAATQSGTWTVQPGNTANTTPWLAKIHDGTTAALVKAASTPSAATDPALIVTQNPLSSPVCTSFVAISQTAGTTVITGVSAKKIHICAITLVANAAEIVSVIEGTGTVCATGGSAIYGSTTAASGMSFAANGGMAQAASRPFVVTSTNADNLCIIQSTSSRVTGSISYVIQ